MNWRRRLMWTVFFTVLGGVVLRWHGLRVGGPHELTSASARLSPSLERRIDRLATSRRVDSPRKAIDLALELTSQGMKLGTPTHDASAADGSERVGGPKQYAALFVAIFNRVADGQSVEARAHVIESDGPRLFGVKLPSPGFAQHHWVLVQPKDAVAAESWFVDPTLHDLLLGWSIEGNVTGLVPVTASAPAEDDEEEYDDLDDEELPAASKAAQRGAQVGDALRAQASTGKAKNTMPAVTKKSAR